MRGCAAMNKDGNCDECSCHWSKHMHVTYENELVSKQVIDTNVEKQIREKESYQDLKIAIIEDKEQYINKQKREQERISAISIKLFLRQNAIAAYNDTYADYLDHFINEEKIKKSSDPSIYDDRILRKLETLKREYLEKIAIIKKAIESNDHSVPQISLREISNLEQELYELPLNGETLRRIRMEAERGRNAAFRYEEKRCTQQGYKFWNKISK